MHVVEGQHAWTPLSKNCSRMAAGLPMREQHRAWMAAAHLPMSCLCRSVMSPRHTIEEPTFADIVDSSKRSEFWMDSFARRSLLFSTPTACQVWPA